MSEKDTETVEKTGQCLCGQVRIHAPAVKKNLDACHCGMCRKWGGGPFMAVDAGTDVRITGTENITVYDSSEWAERGFCKNCGTHLFYRLKQINQHILPVGLLDDDSGLVFSHQIFIDRKSPLYNFAESTENMTEAEVFAKYAPELNADESASK